MVKTVLDTFCVKSGILCNKCQEKVTKGQITDLDLEVIKVLSELEKKYPILKDVFFHRSTKTDGMLAVLVSRKDMVKILSYGGKIIKELEKKTKKRIKILGYGSDQRELLEELFSPFSILTINTIWLPDGTTETKVIVQGRKPRRNPIDFNVVKQLAKEIGGLTLRTEFERN